MNGRVSVTDAVAAVLAVVSVGAIVYLAIDGSPNAQTALTGLVLAVSSFYLGRRMNGRTPPKEPPTDPS
jgi:multisubunit Na+/H+ antiporter MnhE subunit